MGSYSAIKEIYTHLQDDVSREIFLKRLRYSLSGEIDAVMEMVDAEIWRYGIQDIMFCLFRWLAGKTEKVIVFGAGFAGYQICSVLHRHSVKISSIADNDRSLWGSSRDGIGIISPADIDKDSQVIIGINSCVPEIFKQLVALGIGGDQIFVPHKQWWLGRYPQYFDPEILQPQKGEVFIDGGALDGGDSLHFIKWCGGDHKAIYAFEPDAKNCRRLRETTLTYPRIHVYEEGLWSEETTLRFSAGKAENCAISKDGEATVKVTSVDKSLGDIPISFIKMDIEGSEMEALCGAETTIRKYKPKLAICVYHKPEDILDIPLKILGMDPGYRLYLRHYSYVDTETVLYAV